MEDESELRNPFPSPPSHYVRYTDDNLRLLSLFLENSKKSGLSSQQEALSGETNIPNWPLEELEKPKLELILEDGEYTVFGDCWKTKEHIPGLRELGGTQLYPEDKSIDRRPVLQTILRSLLLSYSYLLKSILLPPPSIHTQDLHDWHRHLDWITVMSQNIIAAANDLRPAQARVNIEALIRNQIELRRSETQFIQRKCESFEKLLETLKSVTADIGNPTSSLTQRQNALERKDAYLMVQISEALYWADDVTVKK